jgi:hypothetical protein
MELIIEHRAAVSEMVHFSRVGLQKKLEQNHPHIWTNYSPHQSPCRDIFALVSKWGVNNSSPLLPRSLFLLGGR